MYKNKCSKVQILRKFDKRNKVCQQNKIFKTYAKKSYLMMDNESIVTEDVRSAERVKEF